MTDKKNATDSNTDTTDTTEIEVQAPELNSNENIVQNASEQKDGPSKEQDISIAFTASSQILNIKDEFSTIANTDNTKQNNLAEGKNTNIEANDKQGTSYAFGSELAKATNNNLILLAEIESQIAIKAHEQTASLLAKQAQENKVLEIKLLKLIKHVAQTAPAARKELAQMVAIVRKHAEVKDSLKTPGPAPKKAAA